MEGSGVVKERTDQIAGHRDLGLFKWVNEHKNQFIAAWYPDRGAGNDSEQ